MSNKAVWPGLRNAPGLRVNGPRVLRNILQPAYFHACRIFSHYTSNRSPSADTVIASLPT